MEKEEISEKEKRIASLALAYYSRSDIQKAIWEFCQNRETVPRHFDIFSKRPDSLEYPNDIFQNVKKGWSSFHCSEELWHDPLKLSPDLRQEEINQNRNGWDLLIDIDCKWFDYSKKAAQAVIATLKHHGIKNIGIKFSGGKGFHILVPWKAIPKEINGKETKDLFPEIPRKIAAYIRFYAEKILKDSLPDDFYSQFKNVNIKKGVKCTVCNEISSNYRLSTFICKKCKREEVRKINDEKKYKCPDCRIEYEEKDSRIIYECKKCNINSKNSPEKFSQFDEVDLFELMGLDIVLVSPRHLFRAPYSLHEKGLVSVVIDENELEIFQPTMADPLRVKIKNFLPNSEEEEARELVITALDWHEIKKDKKERQEIEKKFEQVKIDKSKIVFPPCISNIMKGLADGRKRAVFILINYFNSLNFDFDEIESKLLEWNKLNKPPLKEGYIHSQLSWSKNQKKMLPPNCDKDYYKGIGVCTPDSLCSKIKNPVNYTVRKQFKGNSK